MSGGSLAALISRFTGGISLALTKSLALDILNGLNYLHLCKVVHRDVKPENILLTSEGSNLHAKLAGKRGLVHWLADT